MRRQENQPIRPTAGCLSVPLFNQKKRNRVPLTSAPSENEFFSHSEYITSASSAQYGSNRPAPGPAPAIRTYTPTAHPYKVGSRRYCIICVSAKQDRFPMKPAIENSLRILTSVIDGMRHWSQFKDKVPYLFEIFATLDSAVTLDRLGAKNFLMRDGKEVVTCVFYENEQELPRLIRGQVHRCVGNYDRSRDVLMCVSVRPGLPSELRNAQEAVKACDAEMRALVKLLSEV
uniref:Spermatogenesis associated 22 n=1 Tax=Cyclopterus lumpus TaxID=8103 RepID=A0A8C2WGU0_CYCLU